MKRSLFSRVFCILMAALLLSQTALAAPLQTQGGSTAQLEAAIQAAIQGRGETPFLFFETGLTRPAVSSRGDWGSAWIYPIDPDIGQAVPTEPGLVLAQWRDQAWQVVFPADPRWPALVEEAPEDLITASDKEEWLQRYLTSSPETGSAETDSAETISEAPYSGFLLPWAKGLKIILTRSITHYIPISPDRDMHYAFDFAHPWVDGSSPQFNLYAAKTGTVKRFRTVQWDDDHTSPGNYLVIEDLSTIPATYHLYLHLAYDSIPPELRVIGAPVYQGQFIGKAGNTGMSTGNHLHFQVHTNALSYWGKAVDITFDDVTINGGRPRQKREATYYPQYGSEYNYQDAFYSNNNVRVDFVAPEGDILAPDPGDKITAASMTVEAWATDDQSGVYSAHVLADWGAGWRAVSNPFNTVLFTTTLNVCTLGIPDGPFSLALRIQDWENNLSPDLTGLRHYLKEYNCPPPPTCAPGLAEVALYAEADYRGACRVFSSGVYTSTQISLSKVASIQVGSGAQATLFQNTDSTGRAESFFAPDSSLADNRIGSGAVGTLLVAPRTAAPAAPQPVWPLTGTLFTNYDSFSLSWEDRGGGQKFEVELLNAPTTTTLTTTLQSGSAWNLTGANLPPGSYSWRVRAVHSTTNSGSWSNFIPFSITNTITSTPSITSTLPFTLDMETGLETWNPTGLWRPDGSANHTPGGANGWAYRQEEGNYATPSPTSGSLTSPSIFLPSAEPAVLRFWYRYQTESPGRHWDRRWVQISVDKGPFANLFQLYDDPPGTWLQSPEIDLTSYAGKMVRIRFHFESLDTSRNSFSGWEIDDLVFQAGPVTACSSLPAVEPAPITLGASQGGTICPAGDVDLFSFTAAAGQSIEAFIQAPSASSSLDAALALLDADGQSVLAYNNDSGVGSRDPALSYTFSRAGTYTFKVQAWDHPSAGAETAAYTLTVQTAARPSLTLAAPAGEYLPLTPFTLTATLDDPGSGPSKVAFYVHSADWMSGQWKLLGEDADGSDGWSWNINPVTLPEGHGIAFYAVGYDAAGLTGTAAVWKLNSDHTPPVTALKSLVNPATATAIRLEWTASDNAAGIDLLEIERKIGEGSWESWLTITELVTSTWMVGEFGKTYSFRMRAHDRAGNWEALPASAEATTTLPTSCTEDVYDKPANNSRDTAVMVTGSAVTQTHTFCNPLLVSRLQDEDWLAITVPPGQSLFVRVTPVSPAAAATLELYNDADPEGLLIGPVVPSGYGQPSSFHWAAGESEQTVYLRMRHPVEGVAGAGTSYTVSIFVGYPVWMPLIKR
jgi:murein DD-endopeptidase MepM/ murein hydrolase activator NlpD